MNKDELKLIYVHKAGENVSGEGIYEFIFSKDPTNILMERWQWDASPACDNAMPPDKNHIDLILTLKTDKFKLFCLHEAVDREYMHGYHLIHALAYEVYMNDDGYDSYGDEDEDEDDEDFEYHYDKAWDLNEDHLEDEPLLVFHYGASLQDVEDAFYERDIILRDDKFLHSSNITMGE